MATQLNVREFIDEQPLSGFQKWIIALCLLVVIVDGLDVAAMGFIAPSLKEQWGISNSDLAPVISAALFGLTIGAMVAGPMADKFGRKSCWCVCGALACLPWQARWPIRCHIWWCCASLLACLWAG